MNTLPAIAPYRYHALLCAGKNCTTGLNLVKYLRARLQEEGLDQGSNHVRVNRAGCLGICTQGPIMVVYPEGVWYAALDEVVIDRIIERHFKSHQPLLSHCFYQRVTG